MSSIEIAKRMTESLNAHGAGLSADYSCDGYAAVVTILDHGRRIGHVEIDSDGDYELFCSRRRGLIRQLVDGAAK